MAVEQVMRIVVGSSYGGLVTCNNVFHVATDTPGVGPGLDATDLAANFRNAVIRNPVGPVNRAWMTGTSAFLTFNTVSVQRLYPDASDAGTAGLGLTGLSTSAMLPAPCAGIITWRTSYPGRSGRGRSYLAGIQYYTGSVAPADVVAPQASSRTILSNIATDFVNALVVPGGGGRIAGGWYLCVKSTKVFGKIPPYNLAGLHPVVDWSVPNYWGTMGSRRGGHGI